MRFIILHIALILSLLSGHAQPVKVACVGNSVTYGYKLADRLSHLGWFIMAGGSFFPKGKPWENGTKKLSDKVLIFSQQADATFSMVYEGNDLPLPQAEGAYASLPVGLLCMGGQTPEGITAECRLLSFDGSRVTITPFPPLPLPVKNATATLVGSRIYLLGGERADGTSSNQFLALDTDNPQAGWQPLPHFPVPVSGSTITAQQDGEEISLYVFDGRAKVNSEATTTFYPTVYHYRPSQGSWSQKRVIQLKNEEPLPQFIVSEMPVGFAGLLILLWIRAHSPLSFLLYGFLGMTAGILIAVVVSYLLPNKKEVRRYTWEGI